MKKVLSILAVVSLTASLLVEARHGGNLIGHGGTWRGQAYALQSARYSNLVITGVPALSLGKAHTALLQVGIAESKLVVGKSNIIITGVPWKWIQLHSLKIHQALLNVGIHSYRIQKSSVAASKIIGPNHFIEHPVY